MPKKKRSANQTNGKSSARKKTPKKKPEDIVQTISHRSVKRHIPPSEKAVYANHLMVRGEPDTFQLMFFDIMPPVVAASDSDEIKAEAKSRSDVDAYCVSRVVIPQGFMLSVISVLQENLAKHPKLVEAFKEMQSQREQSE